MSTRNALDLDAVRSKPVVQLTSDELDLIKKNNPREYGWVIAFLARCDREDAQRKQAA